MGASFLVKNNFSNRSNIAAFVAMEMMERANILESKGKDIIHMDVGEPGFNTPSHVLKYLESIIQESSYRYTEALGMPKLREAISLHYKLWYKEEVDPGCVVVTVGASGAFILSLLAFFDVGDKVGIMSPYYPAYTNALKALGIEVVIIEGNINNGYQPTLSMLKNSSLDLKGLIIASPANPTGSIIDNLEMLKISKWCGKNNIKMISDEIYHGIEYENRSNTVLSYDRKAIVVNSFSKYFSMTGWRLGWIIAPKSAIRILERLAMACFLCPPAISQLAAIKVFDDYDVLDKNVSVYKNNRDLLINLFEDIGLTNYAPPNGAFYLYVDITKISNNSADLALSLLKEVGVSCTPGIDFDRKYGKNFIRFSYGGPSDKVSEGAKRIKEWIKK